MTDESGAVVKSCVMCGRRLVIPDWYAAIRTKYCPDCAAAAERMQNANRMRELRRQARERRKLERQIAEATGRENELLREAVRLQAERIEALERMIGLDEC